MIFATTPTTNDKNGNGRYSTLRRRKKAAPKKDINEFNYLSSNDPRMRFNTSKDPIYHIFESLEKRSVLQLMGDFIEDSIFEVTSLVSKVVK